MNLLLYEVIAMKKVMKESSQLYTVDYRVQPERSDPVLLHKQKKEWENKAGMMDLSDINH